MAYYDDLSDYGYHPAAARPRTRNVGWLDAAHAFATEEPTHELLATLWQYCKVSVAQLRGVHECEFCPGEHVAMAERNGERLLLGTSEIRVFAADDDIYAAPTQIYHYVQKHGYRPPDAFVKALFAGPVPPAEAYFDRLRQLGLAWNDTSNPPANAKPFRF